ncbi:MAG: hypothetical protein AB7G93_12835 [Bdellovibrionales bacterium]
MTKQRSRCHPECTAYNKGMCARISIVSTLLISIQIFCTRLAYSAPSCESDSRVLRVNEACADIPVSRASPGESSAGDCQTPEYHAWILKAYRARVLDHVRRLEAAIEQHSTARDVAPQAMNVHACVSALTLFARGSDQAPPFNDEDHAHLERLAVFAGPGRILKSDPHRD